MSTTPGTIGRILSVNISPEKSTQKSPVPEIALDELGVVDDSHRGPWHRQVTFLDEARIRAFAEESGIEIGHGDFAENITTSGIDLERAALLDTITAGEAVLEVTQIGKVCHGSTCAIFRQVGECLMPKEGIFCRTVTGGRIRPGDAVRLKPRSLALRIITMSDRASRGDYEDKGGPRVEELLKEFLRPTRWHGDITRTVLPDDAGRLREELGSACASGADVVVITGGTGVGPRDVTPEVVTELADKVIPGIMEHVRLKYGAEKPRALISRSVAAVAGSTLLYAIPGSVRAVDDYMTEILKTVEHLILMIHGIDAH